jgi:hypothetical protein
MKVRLVTLVAADGTCISSLTPGAEYEVLGIEADWLRLLNDQGEPVLYDPACFQVTDPTEPEDWVSRVDAGARYSYPPCWGRIGFFENWHDGVPEVRRRFTEDIARRSGHSSDQV